MKTDFELPQNYNPFQEIIFCSNRLVNVAVPILLMENIPICLIGRGPVPLVWLSGPIEPHAKIWNYVVIGGSPLKSAIDLKTDWETNTVLVKVGPQEVLRAKKLSEDRAVVDLVDFRPLGLNVYGTMEELNVGQNKFIRNHFIDLRVAFAVSKPE